MMFLFAKKMGKYNLFMLFETENLHFKNFWYGHCHFVLEKNEPKCLRMYPIRKIKMKIENIHTHLFFLN